MLKWFSIKIVSTGVVFKFDSLLILTVGIVVSRCLVSYLVFFDFNLVNSLYHFSYGYPIVMKEQSLCFSERVFVCPLFLKDSLGSCSIHLCFKILVLLIHNPIFFTSVKILLRNPMMSLQRFSFMWWGSLKTMTQKYVVFYFWELD